MVRLKSLATVGCAFSALLIIGGSTAWSQEAEPPKAAAAAREESNTSAWLHGIYYREMAAYDFFLDAERQHKLFMRREPVLRYPAPPENCWGEIYVWTERGRPAVVGCVFGGPGETTRHRIFHEFHSLSPKPLVTVGGATGWQPAEAGLKFEPVPDATAVDIDKARRLTQMWAIARRFKASMNWNNTNVELRFVPQPLYRYEVTDADLSVVDGALFAYAHNEIDDPELLLVIEAQRVGNEVRWYYAPVRFTNREAWVKFKGEEVWRIGAGGPGIFDGVKTKPYGVFLVKTIRHDAQAK